MADQSKKAAVRRTGPRLSGPRLKPVAPSDVTVRPEDVAALGVALALAELRTGAGQLPGLQRTSGHPALDVVALIGIALALAGQVEAPVSPAMDQEPPGMAAETVRPGSHSVWATAGRQRQMASRSGVSVRVRHS